MLKITEPLNQLLETYLEMAMVNFYAMNLSLFHFAKHFFKISNKEYTIKYRMIKRKKDSGSLGHSGYAHTVPTLQ